MEQNKKRAGSPTERKIGVYNIELNEKRQRGKRKTSALIKGIFNDNYTLNVTLYFINVLYTRGGIISL